jgi:hypothetical protein
MPFSLATPYSLFLIPHLYSPLQGITAKTN